MKNRELILVQMEVLASLFEGSKGPTKLAQAVNVNYGRMEGLMKPLTEKGLVRVKSVEGQEVFAITDEGLTVYRDWLEIWRRLPLT